MNALTRVRDWWMKATAPVMETPAQSAPVEGKALTLPISNFWLPGNPLYVTDEDRPLTGAATFALSVLCYAPMRFRATTFVEAALWLVDETDDGEEWLRSTHPLERLLERPNRDMAASRFWERVSFYLDMPGGGSCLLLKTRDRAGRVASLYPYARHEFTVEPAEGRLFGRFRVTHFGGRQETYGPDDVIYLYEADPRDPLAALSPGDAALRDLNLSEQQRNAVAASFRHAIMPGSVTSVKESLGAEEFERWRSQVQATYGGAQNAGKHILVEGAAEVEFLKNSLKELDFGPLSDRLEATIASAFGINPLLLGWHSSASMNGGLADSLEPALANYYRQHGVPRWRWISDEMTEGLLRGDGGTDPTNYRRFLRFDTSAVQALQEDVAEKAAWLKDADWITADEKRKATGYAPLTPEQREELSPAPVAPDEEDDAPRLSLVKARRRVERKDWTPESMAAAWAEFDTKAASQEDSYERAALALFRAEKAAVVARIQAAVPDGYKMRIVGGADPVAQRAIRKAFGLPETNGTAVAEVKADDPPEPDYTAPLIAPYLEGAVLQIAADYAPGGDFHAEWVKRFVRLIGQTLVDGGRQVAGAVGIRFGLDDPLAIAAVERRARELADLVGEETAERVTKVVADARRDGLSMRKVVAAIRAEFDEMTPVRATRIARTETVGALNEGRKVGANASGMQAKRWGSQKVGDVRRNHVQWDNEGWKPIDYLYPGAKGGMQHPGDRAGGAKETVNCRCFLIFDDRTPEEIAEEGDE